MSVVEDRIVEMRFDNRDFVNNVNATLPVLDKLTNGIRGLAGLPGSALNGLTGITASVKALPGAVLSATTQVELMHRALNTVLGVAENLKNEFYSITFDQIGAGFDKYGEKTTSVQTIMAATGKSVEEVEEQLARLTWFSDETSYSFTDMVSNVGKFTSQGIDLENAVTQMQGIATWSAKSGQNTQAAARAMYNISQAMGTGAMMTKDWMSIENANMATAEFKQLAIDTAVELGKIKKGKVTIENFRDSLSKGWFDTDVMTKVFEQYGGYADSIYQMSDEFDTASEAMEAFNAANKDAVGSLGQTAFLAAQEAKTFEDVINATKDAVSTNWMDLWQAIFGNYEEARVLWTELANNLWDVFAGPINTMKKVMQEWHDLGGRNDLIDIYHKLWGAVFGYDVELKGENDPLHYAGVIEKIGQALHKIIPGFKEFEDEQDKFKYYSWAVKQLTDNLQTFTIRFTKLIQKFEIKNSTIDKLANGFQGILATFRLFGKAVDGVIHFIDLMSPALNTVFDFLVDIISEIGLFIVWLDKIAEETDFFKKLAEGTVVVLTGIKDAFVSVGKAIIEFFNKLTENDKGKGLDFLNKQALDTQDNLGKIALFITNFGKVVANTIGLITPIIVNAFNWIKDGVKKLWNTITGLGDAIKWIGESFKTLLSGAGELGKKSETKDGTGEFLDKLLEKLEKFQDLLGTIFSGTVASGFLTFLFVALAQLKKFDWGIGNIMENVVGLKTTLETFVKSFSKTGLFGEKISKSFSGLMKSIAGSINAGTIKSIAISIAILAGSLLVLSLIPTDKLIAAGVAIGVLGEGLIGFMKEYQMILKGFTKGDEPKMLALGAVLATLAISIGILAAAMTQMSFIGDMGRIFAILGAAVLGIASLSGVVVGLVQATKNVDPVKMLAVGAVLITMAYTMTLLAGALAILAIFKPENLVTAGLSLLFIAVGLASLVAVLGVFAEDEKKAKAMVSAGIALGMIAKAVVSVATAAAVLSKIDAEGLKKAGIAIASIMAGMAAMIFAASLISNAGQVAGGLVLIAGGLIAVSFALNLFAAAMLKSAQAIALLAVVFEIVDNIGEGGVDKLQQFFIMLIDLIPSLIESIVNGILYALTGMPIETVLHVFGMLFEAMLTAMETFGPRVIESMTIMVGNFIDAFSKIVEMFKAKKDKVFEAVKGMLELFKEAFDKNEGKIGEIITALLNKLLEIIKASVPNLGEALKELLLKLTEIILELLPNLVEIVYELTKQLLIATLKLLYEFLPQINQFIVDSINWLNAALLDLIPQITSDAIELLYRLLETLINKIPALLVQSITILGVVLKTALKSIIEAILQIITLFIDGAIYLMQRVVDLVYEYKDPMMQALVDFINAIADVLEQDIDPLLDAIDRVISALIDIVIQVVQRNDQKIIDAGKNIIKGLMNGITAQSGELFAKVSQVGNKILSKIAASLKEESPSKATTEMGEYLMEGLSLGMKSGMTETLATASKSGGSILDSLKNSFTGVSDYIHSNMEMSPTITPVLDLSNVRNNMGSLSSMFGSQQINAIATGGGFASASMMGTDINAMSNMMQKLNDKLDDLHVTTSATPVEVNVNLEGDTNKLFKAMVDKNNDKIRATGFNQFTRRRG